MSLIPRFVRALVALSLFVLAGSITQAQITAVGDDTSTPIPGAGHDYIKLLNETVNPANGSLSVRIDVPMPKGRGLTLPFSFNYDSNGVNHLLPTGGGGSLNWVANTAYLAQGGWAYSVPSFADNVVTSSSPTGTCYYATDFMFQDATGGRHALGLAVGGMFQLGNQQVQCGLNVSTGGDQQFYATTPPGCNTVDCQLVVEAVTVYDADGTMYVGLPSNSGPAGTGGGLASLIRDRNGNEITITDSHGGVFTMKDTLGRQVLSSSGFGPSGSTNTVSISGLANQYQISWETVSANYIIPEKGVSPGPCGIGEVNNTAVVIKSITLPNSEEYQFFYDSHGLISEIVYPTGAWIKYTWKASDTTSEIAEFPLVTSNFNGLCITQYAPPVIATRTVSFNGSTAALTQSFTYNTNWATGNESWTTKNTTVNSTDNITNKTAVTKYTYSWVGGPNNDPDNHSGSIAGQIPVEQQTQYYDWGGTTLLETVVKAWNDPYRIKSQQVTIGTQTSQITYPSYTPGVGSSASGSRLAEKDEFDFGQSTASRKTVYNYQAFSGAPGILTDRPCQILIEDGSGNRRAETDYFYDGNASTTPCSASAAVAVPGTGLYTNHDETNFGSSSTLPRGNGTKITKQCFARSQACANDTTTASYDETGQVSATHDANGNPTSYFYTDSYTTLSGSQNISYTPTGNPTNALLTKTTDAAGHSSTFSYDYNNSQLTIEKDPNDIAAARPGTTYVYNDPFNRPRTINYPDGGLTTINYNDAGPSPSVATSRLMNLGGDHLTSSTTMDGLGHVTLSEITSDATVDCSAGNDITTTAYDGFGRVLTKSNPYCTTTDPTYGLATYSYDGLGRVTQITNPDSTTVLTTYSGRATQTQDEGNGNGTQRITRISQTDGLGRLVGVCEVAAPPFVVPSGSSTSSLIGQNGTPASCGLDVAGSGFLTTYSYDTLDNLQQATQGTMAARTFSYDSLSRLLCASNPENSTAACPSTASLTYINGTIGYSYDANGNLKTKTGPNQTSSGIPVVVTYQYDSLNRLLAQTYNDGSTPASGFEYDSDPNLHLTNAIGRRVGAFGAPGIATYSQYDAMGRVSTQYQYLPVGSYTVPYTYDYLGNIKTQSDGYFHTYTFSYNTASRLTGLTVNLTPSTLLSGAHYNAAGQVTSDTLGTNEVETYAYTHRNQLQAETAKLSATQTYAYGLTFAPDGDVTASTDSVNFNWAYSYDQFNRLVCSNLATNGTCASPTSGTPTYSYVYDRFGNRWQQNGPHSMIETFTGNNLGNNNRMDVYTYDAAGNLLNDGTHTYTYDAENRIVKVATSGTTIATYAYDAGGQRVYRTGVINDTCDGTGNRGYVYDLAGHWILEVSNGGTECRSEIYAGSRHFVTDADGNTFFDHSDWLGTVRLRNTYANPNSFTTCTSLPFGDALSCVGNDLSTIHFTGKERDAESGLDNFEARYNSSNLGRFMSANPYNAGAVLNAPQSWNAYSYVLNNPLNAVDPTGLDCVYTAGASDNPNPHEDGSATIVPGDCVNSGGKNDSGVFVDNDPNHHVQSSDVTVSSDGSVGVVSYTRADGVSNGYACFGDCPAASSSVQVTAAPPGTPEMSAAPYPGTLVLPDKRPMTFWLRLAIASGCTLGTDAELMESDSKPSNGNDRPDSKLAEGKYKVPFRRGTPGRPPEMNKSGKASAEAANAAAGVAALVGNQQECMQNASSQ
jgi:RHS repeat-associated protein